MTGHIKLGVPGSLREYAVKQQGEGIAWGRGPADPFAGKVNTSNKYDEIDAWNEYVQEDWQAGVGRIDPEAGGFFFAEAETRVPNQVILPPLLQQADKRQINNTVSDCRYMPEDVAGTVVVGAGGYAKVAIKMTTPSTVFGLFQFLGRVGYGVSVTLTLYSDSAGSPNTSLLTQSFTGDLNNPAFHWYGTDMTAATGAAASYWVSIEPTSGTDSIEIAYGTANYNAVAKSYSGGVWSNISSTYLIYTTNLHNFTTTGASSFVRFNGTLYVLNNISSGFYVTTYSSVNNNFTGGVVNGTTGATSAVVFGPNLYIGQSSGNHCTMSTGGVVSTAAVTRKLFLEYKGLLYSTWQNNLYYSSDGSTWSSAYTVGGSDSEIRGLAGLGDSVYLATDKAIFRFAPGNVVEEVTRFGAESSSNGAGMMEYNGRLYIPSAGRLFRFDPSGQLMDIWINRDDDLPATQIGSIEAMCRMNNWLIVHTVSPNTGGRSSLWAWQEEGWHFLAEMPQQPALTANNGGYSVLYDRSTSRLWFSSKNYSPFYVKIDDYTLNPYNSTSYKYMPNGWWEQDRFYGGLLGVNKDFDGVRIYGDNLSSNVYAKVYWQDEGSTGWELLGTFTTDGQETRWTAPYSTRPQGKWVKLGVLLSTNDADETPRIRAVVLKNLPMTNDRISDTMTLELGDSIHGVDGVPNTYTLLQQKTHLQSMISSIVPVIYEDPFGTQYEVKVEAYNVTIGTLGWESGAKVIKRAEWPITVRQVTDTTYTP